MRIPQDGLQPKTMAPSCPFKFPSCLAPLAFRTLGHSCLSPTTEPSIQYLDHQPPLPSRNPPILLSPDRKPTTPKRLDVPSNKKRPINKKKKPAPPVNFLFSMIMWLGVED